MVRKLHDRVDELVEKNMNLEQSHMSLKLQDEKKSIRLMKIQSEMRKSIIDHNVLRNNSLEMSFKENHTLSLSEDEEKN